MKTINITTGGFPLLGEYLLELQSGLMEALKGATSYYDDKIISGCKLTNTGGTNWTCDEGYIKWGGVIYHVPAHAFVIAVGQQPVVYKETTNTLVYELYQIGSQPTMVADTVLKVKGALAPGAGEVAFGFFSDSASFVYSA